MENASDDELIDAVVTFVMFRGECLAFMRAYKAHCEKEWSRITQRLKGDGKFSYWANDGYAHNGQHGEFDIEIMRHSRRATKAEYAPLVKELKQVGYGRIIPHQKGRLKLKGLR